MTFNDRVDQIAATIDELREAAPDGRRSRELVDALFRTVHSLKAAASAEGVTHLRRTAHEFENLLHSIRAGSLNLNAEVLRAFDETVVALRSGTSTAALSNIHQSRRQTMFSDDALPAEFANLKAEERQRALAALSEGAKVYVMEAEFEANDFDERFRKLKQQLEEDAELISTSATMKAEKIVFQVVYASTAEKIRVQNVLSQAARAGQAVARQLGKNVTFVVQSEELLLEKSWADVLKDALLHLVRNAVDHGIESAGTVTIAAAQNEITVTDDGRGMNPEHLTKLFQPGFSTAQALTEFSGRGVGLDAVKTAIEQTGGGVNVRSEPGKGSSFIIKFPDQSKTSNPSSDA